MAALILVVAPLSIAAGCSWDFPEYTKRQLEAQRDAKRIEVTGEDLPAGTYEVLGPCSGIAVHLIQPKSAANDVEGGV